MMDVKSRVIEIAKNSRKAAGILSRIPTDEKNRVLLHMADELTGQTDQLIAANAKDLDYARKKGLSAAMIDRLTLKEKTIKGIADGLKEVAALSDPVGKVISMWRRPNGLLVGRMRIPLGVIGIIYESRPNVTVDAAALCLKSGNAVILRGGSEAIHSNIAIAGVLQSVLQKSRIPADAIQIIPMTDRSAVHEMLQLEEYIDVIIPRGGEELIRAVVNESKIPVIKHYKGVCHIFVDASADFDMAVKICMNAKTQRPGVCNAMETLLVHKEIADRFLPVMARHFQEAGVILKG